MMPPKEDQRGVYTYVCDLCGHPMWDHDTPLSRCIFSWGCDCPEKSPDAPVTGITRAEYEARFLADRADDLGANTMGEL